MSNFYTCSGGILESVQANEADNDYDLTGGITAGMECVVLLDDLSSSIFFLSPSFIHH